MIREIGNCKKVQTNKTKLIFFRNIYISIQREYEMEMAKGSEGSMHRSSFYNNALLYQMVCVCILGQRNSKATIYRFEIAKNLLNPLPSLLPLLLFLQNNLRQPNETTVPSCSLALYVVSMGPGTFLYGDLGLGRIFTTGQPPASVSDSEQEHNFLRARNFFDRFKEFSDIRI